MCEWIGFSPNIVALIREKNNLWKKNKQYMRDGRCNRLILDHLKDISRKLVHMKAMAKEKYYSAKFANCVSSKDTWKTIKEVISTGKRNDNDFVYLEEDGVPVNEATVADKFAEYFSTVGQNLADEIETGPMMGLQFLTPSYGTSIPSSSLLLRKMKYCPSLFQFNLRRRPVSTIFRQA